MCIVFHGALVITAECDKVCSEMPREEDVYIEIHEADILFGLMELVTANGGRPIVRLWQEGVKNPVYGIRVSSNGLVMKFYSPCNLLF